MEGKPRFRYKFPLIQKKDAGKYSVGFDTFGCLDRYSLQREATYKDGVLRLNKAVAEYCPFTYDTLYTISVDGKEYLISQSMIRFLVENYSKKGRVNWPEHLWIGMFHREEKPKNQGAKKPIRITRIRRDPR